VLTTDLTRARKPHPQQATEIEVRMQVLAEFAAVCGGLGVEPAVWAETIGSRYSEPGRFYHTLAHLAAMLRELRGADTRPRDECAVAMAIFFHDLVYDARSKTNEEDSARLWEAFARDAKLEHALEARVTDWILQTKHHMDCDPHSEPDKLLFLDLDLSVLGGEATEYDAYSDAIRREYAHVSDSDFRAGRAAVLRTFLAKENLYFTPEFQRRLQQRARANLERELQKLV
jgi:predicted metal-dependent HD superfamily phosphohydrolase